MTACGQEKNAALVKVKKVLILWIKIWELLEEYGGTKLELNVKHVKAHRTKQEQKAMTEEQQLVMEGNEKAGELAEKKGRWRGKWRPPEP